MKRSAVLLCVLTLVIAAVPRSSPAALQLTSSCDLTALGHIVALKQGAIDDLRELLADIADDPALGVGSDTYADLRAAIEESLEPSLDAIRDKNPCTISADEAEELVDALETEESGIESLIDFSSEDIGNDQFLAEEYVRRAEAAVRDTLDGDRVLAFTLLSRVADRLPSGSSSRSINPAATLADAVALQDACALPRSGATRDTDGTCDDVPGAYVDGIVEIISIIELI